VKLVAHEDKHAVGISDYSFTSENRHGWIELKHCKGYLVSQPPYTVRFPKFTPQQRRYLIDHGRLGATAGALVAVEGDLWFISWGSLLMLPAGTGSSFRFQLNPEYHQRFPHLNAFVSALNSRSATQSFC
tara:strand:+ start:426 stop:815 length:390 start_codon:yes stop_codon:yes gene_type:complete